MTNTNTNTNTNTAMPQMFHHCVLVYNKMHEAANLVDDNGVKRRIWVGYLTKLVNEDCNLAVPYYSGVKNNLVRMGCMIQLQRGGGTHPSTWELIMEPTEDLFLAKGKVRTHSKTAQLEGQVEDLHLRIERIEKVLEAFQG
jgi:hypothetical protein